MKNNRSLARLRAGALLGLLALIALALPALASAAPERHPQPPVSTANGSLQQLAGTVGCVGTGAVARKAGCGEVRAVKGPGVGFGSRAIAISPDGRSVYVASSKSNAIAVFSRDPQTGALAQAKGKAGCVAAKGAEGCAVALGLVGPNSVAVSPDGRTVYATSRAGSSLTTFHRNRKTGALRQLPPPFSGCISQLPIPGCTSARGLQDPDVVVVSGDDKNVYVGAFAGSGVVSFSRNPTSGAVTQLADTAGCITESGAEGCAKGAALKAVEGLAIDPDGNAVYAAAAFANAVTVLGRDASTGALTQATNGSGCLTQSALTGCTQICTMKAEEGSGCKTAAQIAGANAVATDGQGGNVYVTSLFSNSVSAFTTAPSSAGLIHIEGPNGCLVYLRSTACAFGRAMSAPEGLALSNDGTSVYVTAFGTGAIDVLDRNPKTGAVTQKPLALGCVAPKKVPGCTPGRALTATGSIVVSPDGRNVYTTAFGSNAVDVFRRTTSR
jgi:DNA-binding beta-propeller fold protein YncE